MQKTLSDWLIVLPARLKSQRLPEKPLQDLCGEALIVRVYENVKSIEKMGATLVVACDDEKTANILNKKNIPYVMTSPELASGTDRVNAASKKYPNIPFIMNVQGDEPFIEVNDLLKLCEEFSKKSATFEMGTLVYKNRDREDFQVPSIVKVVRGKNSQALYFSRSPIPSFFRAEPTQEFYFWQHLGVYAFRRDTIQKFSNLPVDEIENLEKLEQLRALSHGMNILLVEASKPSMGIDTPEDLAKARQIYLK